MKRKFPKYFIVLFLLSILPLISEAQSKYTLLVDLDDRLYNGKVYSYYPSGSVIGNQFLVETEFGQGVVWISGDVYRNILLNLDVLNQQLLLSFTSLQGANKIISVSLAYIDSFYFENKLFVIERNDNDEAEIYQKIMIENNLFYIRWYKNLNLRTSFSVIQYEFSKSLQKVYFEKSGNRVEVKTNRKFRKLFSKNQSVLLRKYMRSNKMKIAKMSDVQYNKLLIFIKNLEGA